MFQAENGSLGSAGVSAPMLSPYTNDSSTVGVSTQGLVTNGSPGLRLVNCNTSRFSMVTLSSGVRYTLLSGSSRALMLWRRSPANSG